MVERLAAAQRIEAVAAVQGIRVVVQEARALVREAKLAVQGTRAQPHQNRKLIQQITPTQGATKIEGGCLKERRL